MTLLVFGSLNMDLVVQTPRLPVPGETILGTQFDTIPGGKGANQAVAAARQQVKTHIVGRVGADAFGDTLRQTLAADGIEMAAVQVDPTVATGIASITVSAQGNNQIVVVPGANGRVDATDLTHLQGLLPQAQMLLMQLEIPLPMVAAAAEMAHRAGVTVILDPAPAQPLAPETLYRHVHILTPNQVEAAQLVGFPVRSLEDAAAAAQALRQRGVETVMIKLGEQGVFCATSGETFHALAFSVPVVDTVAAGDAFNGGLAAALHQGKPLREAVVWASATAALSVTRAGAQPSLPQRSQVESFLQDKASPIL